MKQTIPKKLASGVVAAAMTLSLLPAAALAADSEYSASGATGSAFTDSGIAVEDGSYTGYKISGTDLTIHDSGTYIVSGNCSDGSITIKKGTTGVTLVLDGLTLTREDTAPIACNKSSEVKIVAASGTGTLNITANGKNGIKSGATSVDEGEASLTIRGLTLNIESGTLNISAGDDAIHCDYVINVGASGTMGPSITIKACYEGLEAATLNILSGNISILSEDECLNAANSDLTGYSFSMTISGGAITAYSSTGDGFDSNGDLTITGGTVVVWTANTADDQPLDADGTLTVSGGTVLAAGGSAGMGVPISAAQPYVTFGSDSSNGSSAPQPVQSSGFTDVAASDWFYSAVRYTYENGLMTGTGSGAFSPNATITRGMLVTILYRLEDEPAVTAANPFTDVSSGSYSDQAGISAFARTAMARANAEGLITGTSGSLLSPKGTATRAQTAIILMRFCQKV